MIFYFIIILISIIGCIIAIYEDIPILFAICFMAITTVILGVVFTSKSPNTVHEKSVEAVSVKVDTVYTICKERTDTTYIIHYLEK